MARRSKPPTPPEALRDEIIGLGTRSLRKSYFGKLQQHVAELARFHALLDVATDAIVVAELPDYRVVDANRAARGLLDPAGDTPKGRPLSSYLSAAVWRRLERLLRRGQGPGGGAEPVVFRTGGRGGRELEVAFREEAFGRARYLVLVARDVTERRRAARALVEAKDEAERVARAKSEFLSIASHELRTPLTSLQLRLQHATRTGKPAAEMAQRLLEPVQRLAAIVEDLLQVSGLERRYAGVRRARVDLQTIVAGVVEGLRARVHRRIELAPGDPVIASADPARAAQAVSKLVENAIKFSPGDPMIEVRVWSDARGAYVAVADHGPGIPEEDRGRLFMPFSRLPGSRTVPGLGLGLYVSRHIARMHGGDVVARETPGGGATFTLSIQAPAAEAADDVGAGALTGRRRGGPDPR